MDADRPGAGPPNSPDRPPAGPLNVPDSPGAGPANRADWPTTGPWSSTDGPGAGPRPALLASPDRPPVSPSDGPRGGPDGERWVTFRELAEMRGISQHSAARLVRRHRWRRQADNQGRVRVLVPAEALDRPADKAGAMPSGGPADSPGAGPLGFNELTTTIDSMMSL